MENTLTSTFAEYERSWKRHLQGHVADSTITAYFTSLRRLAAWAGESHPDPTQLRTADLEDYFADLRHVKTQRGGRPLSTSTIAMDYRHLKVFFRWLCDREDLPTNPMAKVKAPKVAEQPVPVFSDDEIVALIDACEGKGFAERRDKAILLMFMDTGARRAEIANLTLEDVDLDDQLLRVVGKGNRTRYVVYATHAAEALDRYLVLRKKHPDAKLDNLWLATYPLHRGALQYDGIGQMIERRARQAGLSGRVFAHRFRHTFAHLRMSEGMSEGDLMNIGGWKSRTLLDRYGKSAATQRAIKAARKSSPIDRILDK